MAAVAQFQRSVPLGAASCAAAPCAHLKAAAKTGNGNCRLYSLGPPNLEERRRSHMKLRESALTGNIPECTNLNISAVWRLRFLTGFLRVPLIPQR